MSAGRSRQRSIACRRFDLPVNFSAIALLGESWRSHPEPVARMHFHNCMEPGFFNEGSGRLCMEGRELPFKAPCVVMALPNVPHRHSVDEGQICGMGVLKADRVLD